MVQIPATDHQQAAVVSARSVTTVLSYEEAGADGNRQSYSDTMITALSPKGSQGSKGTVC